MVTAISASQIVSATRLPATLVLIENLLEAFHRQEIRYCHWKSSEHLDASMTADTDLDVLFDIQQKEQLEALLAGLGFKKFASIKQKQYKDIEDFIGLDLKSGKVVHLHAHFQMTLGEAYLKGYQLDVARQILDTRVYDEAFGIYRSSPAFELVLLYFREALKLRTRDRINMQLRGKINFGKNSMSEYRWLKERCTPAEIEAVLNNLFDNPRPVYELVTGPFNRKQLFKLQAILKKEYKGSRLFSPAGALLRRWYREVYVKAYRKLSRMLRGPLVAQRVNPRGGLVIGLVGADGSGKSTSVANLKATFKTKLDVCHIYFGRGDGHMSLSRKLLLLAKKVLAPGRTNREGALPGTAPSGKEGKKGLVATVFKCLEAVMVANEKRSNLKLMKAAKAKGMLVICDRFPQNQVMGYNDGPLLSGLRKSGNPLLRWMAGWEASVYAKAESNPPDVLFKLIAEAEVVQARKPGETSLEMLRAKIDGIKKLEYRDCNKVITVDSAQPLDKVLTLIKKEVWQAYP